MECKIYCRASTKNVKDLHLRWILYHTLFHFLNTRTVPFCKTDNLLMMHHFLCEKQTNTYTNTETKTPVLYVPEILCKPLYPESISRYSLNTRKQYCHFI